MGCSRGKASPNTNTQRQLFAASGGYCQNPRCNTALFVDTHSAKVSVAEMAHIFAAEDSGPRADIELSEEERGSFENLILLCANCHTVIDKSPEDFPDKVVTQWKTEHQTMIAELFGSVRYKSREEAREALRKLMARTRSIHKRVGPENSYQENPQADEATEWTHHVRETIIPTNRTIMMLLDRNSFLLSDEELEVTELFRQHINGLEQRHIFNNPLPSAPRYPAELKKILQG